jgi:hypothetical protein
MHRTLTRMPTTYLSNDRSEGELIAKGRRSRLKTLDGGRADGLEAYVVCDPSVLTCRGASPYSTDVRSEKVPYQSAARERRRGE